MKCSECSACHKVTYTRWTRDGVVQTDKYECWGVKEPFEITDVNRECTEYPEKRKKNIHTDKYCPCCGREFEEDKK